MPCAYTPRIPELTSNLVKLYRRKTTDSDIVLGSAWYPNARAIVREWASTYRYHDATVACVIAAISPQCPWPRNLIIADDILANRYPSIGAIRANVRKAELLRDETGQGLLDSAGIRMIRAFPGGPKVTNFALNLAGNDTAITVDTHALQAALNDVSVVLGLNWPRYLCFAEAYERAANKVGRPNAEFQAIIWHTWKRLYPVERKRVLRQQWQQMGEY